MRLTLILISLFAFVLADRPIDYWYRLCSKDTLKNKAITTECPKKGKCLLKSENYQRSLFACYKKAESMSPRPKGMHAYDASWAYMANNLKGTPSMTIHELIALDKSDPVTQTYADANSTKSGAFKPRDKWVTQVNVDGQSEWTYQKIISQTLARTTCYYVFGIVGLQTIFNLLSWVAPMVVRAISNNLVSRYTRRFVVLPALFNKHRSTPIRLFRYIQLCFPPRFHVLMILGYVLLCIVGLAYHYPILFSTIKTTKPGLVGGYLGDRSAAMLVYKLPLIFLFAGRNNFMIWMTGWQMEVFNHWHRWISRLAACDVIIHAIAYTVSDVNGGKYSTDRVPEGWWRAGVVAGICVCIMCVQATKTFRSIAYETFLIFHILLAISFVVCTYYHIKSRSFGPPQLWTVVAVWGFDRTVRFIRTILSGLNNKATIRCMPGGVMEITVQYSGLWKPRAGSYCFVHFSHPFFWFQSHPLSVVPVEGAKNTIKFISKAQKGITRIMHERAAAAGGVLETRVWLDGEYGVQWPTSQYKEIVLFAGGIGMTAVYSHAICLLKNASTEKQMINLHWAISDREPLEVFATELANLSSYPNLNLTIHVNSAAKTELESDKEKTDAASAKSSTIGSDSTYSIVPVNFAPDFFALVSAHVQQCQGPIVFFSCGPPRMADAVRDAVATNLLSSNNYVQFYEESFTM